MSDLPTQKNRIPKTLMENRLADKKWIRIRKDLYVQMERQVRHRLGEDTEELMHYRKVYMREFAKKWCISNKDELWGQVDQSSVVLIGDFHALHQSQKAHLRLLRHIAPRRKIVLAVEFFKTTDQDHLNSYLSGNLSEKDFLNKVQWNTHWGFPWEHYKPLLKWAQKNRVPVFGINKYSKKRNAASLHSRDVFAGKKIAELVNKFPDSVVVGIYGDLHLAKSHIPAQLEKYLDSERILRIYQNAESLYFQILEKGLENNADIVRLGKKSFCLMSVPPWVKWQNYLMYLEQAYDLDLSSEEDDDDNDNNDHTDHVGRYVTLISDELSLKTNLSDLSVYTARDRSFWSQVREAYDLKKIKWIELMIAEELSFYLPEVRMAYLARATVNHAATLALHYIRAQHSKQTRILSDMPEDFLGLIWQEGMAYFGSKIVNHKRKADTLADIKASLASKDPINLGKEALQLALNQKMNELMIISGATRNKLTVKPKKKETYLIAASLLGGMMGERLYMGYRRRQMSTPTLVNFLQKSVEKSEFQVIYFELMEIVESLPAPFLSKKEKL